MASIGPPALGAKGCVERLHPTGETTHYDLCVAGAPANHVRCASLRSGGRRLAVRKTIEYQIGALPRTPFPAAREFPSRGNERYEEKNRGVICFMYYSSISPFGGWRHYLSAPLGSVSLNSQSPTVPCESSSLATSSKGHYKPVLTIESHMGRLPRGALLSHRSAGEGGAVRHQRGESHRRWLIIVMRIKLYDP